MLISYSTCLDHARRNAAAFVGNRTLDTSDVETFAPVEHEPVRSLYPETGSSRTDDMATAEKFDPSEEISKARFVAEASMEPLYPEGSVMRG
jgi:hypothetical protein